MDINNEMMKVSLSEIVYEKRKVLQQVTIISWVIGFYQIEPLSKI